MLIQRGKFGSGRKRIGLGDLDRVENGHGGVELNYSLMVDVE